LYRIVEEVIIELVAYSFFVELVAYMGWFYSLIFRNIDPGIDYGNGDVRYFFNSQKKRQERFMNTYFWGNIYEILF